MATKVTRDFRRVVYNLIKENNYRHIAEIGVWKGELSELIIETKPETFLMIDPHKEELNILNGKKMTMGEDFKRQPELDEIAKKLKEFPATFIRKTSQEAVKDIKDNSLDFVFIDAIHDYKHVKEDVLAWVPKIMPGGMIAGDDYSNRFVGVIKAVNELFPKHERILKVWFQKL